MDVFYTMYGVGEVPRFARKETFAPGKKLDELVPEIEKNVIESDEGKDVKAIIVYRTDTHYNESGAVQFTVHYDLIKR